MRRKTGLEPLRSSRAWSVLAAGLSLGGCAALPPPTPAATSAGVSRPAAMSAAGGGMARADPASRLDQTVGATLLPGRPQPFGAAVDGPSMRRGDVSLDFPGVDVQAVAKAVLGDVLGVPYSLAPDLHTPITLQPGRRIAHADVLAAFEAALRVSGLALVPQGSGAQGAGAYAILPVDQARAVAPVGESASIGFRSEALRLSFVNADELRKLIDPVLPGVVAGTDPVANVLTIAGTEGQRASARDLVRQFDVDWLRGASFGLFIPRRTDSRLIVPELDKVLNGDGAPTRGMVRLIAMDRLNGILAVTTQAQYLEDVRRWIEILDREGENNTRRLFVYKVQNGRAGDLARVLANAFGQGAAGAGRSGGLGFSDVTRPAAGIGTSPSDTQGQGPSPPQGAAPGAFGSPSLLSGNGGGGAPGGSGASGQAGYGSSSGGGANPIGGSNGGGGSTTADLQADDFHAKITSDEINNAIVVYAAPRDYAVIEDALRKLDVAPYQVMIEAAITEVTLTEALRFGVQGLYNNHGVSAGLTEGTTSALPIQNFPGFSTLYAAKSISAALNALEGLTKINVVSAPKLMVLNNQTASIEVGNQVPILTGTATNVVTSSAAVVNSVDYRDTGIILKVTPRVNSSGYVLLDMAQEVSEVVTAASSSALDSPTISTRRIATSVAVKDGEIIALGGMISDSRNDATNGLPFLSRIPVLGPLLFGDIQKNDTRTELIVLLRPTVVRNVEDSRAVTDEIREKLKGLRALLPPGRIP